MKRFVFLLLLSGCCAVCDPRCYVNVPEAWPLNYPESSEFCWWRALNDCELERLILELSSRNLDLLLKAEEGCSCIEYRVLWNKKAAELAMSYVELRFNEERLRLIDTRITSGIDSVDIVQGLSERGVLSNLETIQESEHLSLSKTERLDALLAIEKATRHLSVLMGGSYCVPAGNLPQIPECLPLKSPCEMIRERPDIKMMELAVKMGAKPIRAYQKSVLEAIEEVENALYAFQYSSQKAELLFTNMQEHYNAYEQTEEQHGKGLKSTLELHNAKKAYLVSHETYLQAEFNRLNDYIKLYEALGGSCDCD